MKRALTKWVRSHSGLTKCRKPLIEPMEQRRLLTIAGLGFDFDGLGNPTVPGQNVSNAYANLGITITTNNPAHPPTIFDSDNPTGNFGDIDDDLGTPNQDFGGPGVGPGGSQGSPGENSQAQGHIVILQEDIGLLPDDNATGGVMGFNFANPVDISDISILDVDTTDQYNQVRCFDANGVKIGEFNAQLLGDNSFQTLVIGLTGVKRLEVASPGSFGIPSINFGGPHAEGRMTGGGSIFLQSGDIGGAAGLRVTHGFELHCAQPSELVNNRLQVNWSTGPSNRFHLLTLTEVTCTEDPAIIQAPPDAPIDTLIGVGDGRFSGVFNGKSYSKAAATIFFTFVDGGEFKGEPGINDTADYLITVLDGNGDGNANDPVVVLDTKAARYTLTHGNHQAHDELKNLTSSATLLRSQYNTTLSTFEDPKLSATKLKQAVDAVLSQFAQFETSLTTTSTGGTGGGGGGGGGKPPKGGTTTTSSRDILATEDETEALLA
jgi:hypothetical protein